MWRVIILVKVYSLLVSHVDCEITALGDPIGPKGPTIIEKPNNVDDDLKVATDAINKQKLDPDLVNLIATRTADQRAAIDAAYLKATGNSIPSAVNSFLTHRDDIPGQYLFRGFFYKLPDYLAYEIRQSLERGDSTKDWTYMSILCTSSATKLKAISDAYKGVNGASLIGDIGSRVEEPGRSTFLKMVDPKTMRPDNETNLAKVDEQFALLPIKEKSCDEVALEDFLTSASFAQIKLVVEKYNGKSDCSGKKLADEFKHSCKKGLKQEIYKRIVRYAAAPYEYLAEEFHWGMLQEHHNTYAHRYQLIARSEIDLKDIIAAYEGLFRKTPQAEIADEWIKVDYYYNLFLAVLNGNP
ncbi:annexin A3 isoform X1 [Nilaparvata lugens]|uniref:annexin A3 isoform X1 n=1 Tax=Nilaparvata lugens TaxID=108931 RepID=UPI00193E3004|nr:annexin A3 isoform X1 [Nilaparvata lugens]